MDLFGIDRHEKHSGDDGKCDWFGVREFFKDKLPNIEFKARYFSNKTDSFDKLYSEVLKEVNETLVRQISEVPFLTRDTLTEEDEKLKYAPISNLGCESKVAWIDNRLKISGGSTSVLTLSNKNIICTNKYLVSDEFVDQPAENRQKLWKWARTSEESKKV